MIEEKLVPYMPGDIRVDGTLQYYTGPVFDFHYPVNVELNSEVMGWFSFGYACRGQCVVDKSVDVKVYGRVQDWVLERLSKAGITHDVTQVTNVLLPRHKPNENRGQLFAP